MLLGLIGGITAQYLHATRRRDHRGKQTSRRGSEAQSRAIRESQNLRLHLCRFAPLRESCLALHLVRRPASNSGSALSSSAWHVSVWLVPRWRLQRKFWAGVVFSIATVSLPLSVLFIIHRRAAARAFAVGYLIFAASYSGVWLLENPVNNGPGADYKLPTTRLAGQIYMRSHAMRTRQVAATRAWVRVVRAECPVAQRASSSSCAISSSHSLRHFKPSSPFSSAFSAVSFLAFSISHGQRTATRATKP